MSEDTPEGNTKPSIKSAFKPGKGLEDAPVLFKPDEMDIYVNKITLEAYIFHGKPVEQDIERFEYDPDDHMVTVVKKDGTIMNLGVKIQWLVRPYFTRAQEVGIVRTKDGETLDGFYVPMIHKRKKDTV
ncbi:MAG: hypothetical protein LRZ85_02680 [Alphaproteobacteria bacterium]|nr:hypothetical protein [Alphaproteobacteria bacterium]MCD8525663.1 hypothetical protein [Alphaproteobacteria bacterium]